MVRCQLELQSHRTACWATLTYDEAHLPITLQKDDLSGFVKRLRARMGERRFRFFGCGEYGEKRKRPHYHVILFGLGQSDEREIEAAWGQGIVQVDRLEPAAVAYVAGYTAKKLGFEGVPQYVYGEYERLDRETGEVTRGRHRNVLYQPPFILMSRRPGIGGDARKYWRSWRSTAVWDGKEVRVPRFLHEAFKNNATEAELLALQAEKDTYLAKVPLDSKLRERAGEVIALRRVQLNSERRSKL